MGPWQWLRSALANKQVEPRRPAPVRQRPNVCRLWLEQLEDRLAPALSLVPTATLTQGYVDVVYTQYISASGGSNYNFTETGTLPGGLAFSNETIADQSNNNIRVGALTGTPTQTGTFPISIKVTDTSNGDNFTQNYTLLVNPAVTNPSLSFLQQSVSAGTVGTPYSQQLTDQGGSGSYTYSLGVLVENNDSTYPGSSQYAVIDAALPTGLALNPNTGLVSGTPTQPGVFNVIVQANDGQGNFASQAFSLTIAPLFSLATSNTDPTTLAAGSVGTAYSQTITAQSGGTYTYDVTAGGLPAGLALNSGGTLSGTPHVWGDYGFTVTATNTATGNTGSQAYALTIASPISFSIYSGATPPSNLGPALVLPNSTNNYNGIVNVPYVQPIVEGNGGSFVYELTSAISPATASTLTQNGSTAVLTFTPTTSTDYSFTVTGTDSGGNALPLSYEVTISNPTDVFVYGLDYGLPLAQVGQSYDVTIVANNVTSFTTPTTLLDGLNVTTSGNTIRLSGMPTSKGVFNLVGTANYDVNGTTHRAKQTFQLGVSPPSYTFTINPLDPPFATVGQNYSVQITVQGGTGTYTYSFESGPTFLSLSAAGVLSGTPTETGLRNIVVRVTDANGVIETRVLPLTINPAANFPQLSLVSGAAGLPLGVPGVPYLQTITAVGSAPIQSLTMTLTGALPPGMQINQASPSGPITISGTPSSGFNTWIPVTIRVTAQDTMGRSTSQLYVLNVLNTAQQIRHAYGIDNIIFNGGILGDGTGQTVAIVVSNDAPNLISSTDPNFLASDLYQYDQLMGINRYGGPNAPWFLKLDEYGGTSYPSPRSSSGSTSAGEITQDVEWVHALAPGANIILLEANSGANSDFFTAFQTARNLGASAVSNSYGSNENSQPPGILGFDSFFMDPTVPPVTYFFAMSDPGGGAFVQYNAANRGAVAVAQTQLLTDAQGNYLSEQTVDGTGAAASVLELQPPWQQGVVDAVSTTMRTTTDVSFNGAISTGAAIYQTFGNSSSTFPWIDGNGSSLATPSWAALMAIINQGRAVVGQGPLRGPDTLQLLYSLAGTEDFHAITTLGSGGNDTLVNGGNGYIDQTTISPAFGNYNPWAGLGSPVANLLVADLAGGKNIISGTVFNDLAGNGVLNGSDPGLAGWTVYFDANSNGQLDSNEARTTTNANGGFRFVVAPGTFPLRVLAPTGWEQTTNNSSLVFSVGQNGSAQVNVGFVFPSISIQSIQLTAQPTVLFPTVLQVQFTALGGPRSASSYRATIQWGDGTSSTAPVVSNGSGGFVISASHVFPTVGSFTILVTISNGVASTQISTTILILDIAQFLTTSSQRLVFPSEGTSATSASSTAPAGFTIVLAGSNLPTSYGHVLSGTNAAATISGVLVEAEDGLALANQTIVLELQQGDHFVAVAAALTDAAGRFSFSGLPAGTYRVTLAGDPVAALRIGGTSQAVDIRLIRGRRISQAPLGLLDEVLGEELAASLEHCFMDGTEPWNAAGPASWSAALATAVALMTGNPPVAEEDRQEAGRPRSARKVKRRTLKKWQARVVQEQRLAAKRGRNSNVTHFQARPGN